MIIKKIIDTLLVPGADFLVDVEFDALTNNPIGAYAVRDNKKVSISAVELAVVMQFAQVINTKEEWNINLN